MTGVPLLVNPPPLAWLYLRPSDPPLLDPGRGRLVTATSRVVPGASKGVAVVAERAPVIRRRTLLSSPDRECVPLQLVDVVKGVTRGGVEATLYLLARLRTEGLFVANDLYALDPLPMLLEIDVLDKEEAAFHPLEADPSVHLPGHLPRAHQSIQVLEVGAWLGWLLVSLNLIVGFVCHDGFSLRRVTFYGRCNG